MRGHFTEQYVSFFFKLIARYETEFSIYDITFTMVQGHMECFLFGGIAVGSER